MTRATIAGAALAIALVVLVLALVVRSPGRELGFEPAAAIPLAIPSAAAPLPATHEDSGFLYGRITAGDGATYEGRLRWGGDQEAFWSDFFNGARDENPRAAHAQLQAPPKERRRTTALPHLHRG